MTYRFEMLSDYLDELWKIKSLPPQSQAEKMTFYGEILSNKDSAWIDIKDGNRPVGFLIVGTPPNCHPDASYYIEEAYINPNYRRKGLMSKAVSDFVRNNKGTYCLFILNKNDAAKAFWPKTFAKLGYEPCYLRDVGAGDQYCTQYGYKAKN